MNAKKITGPVGVFIKAKEPKALADWHQEFPGIGFNGNVYIDFPFTGEDGKLTTGYNVLSFFKSDSNYFDPADKQVMLNLRVHDLFALIVVSHQSSVISHQLPL